MAVGNILSIHPPGPLACLVGRWLEDLPLRTDLARTTRIEYVRIAAHLTRWGGGDADPEYLDLRPYLGFRQAEGAAPRTIRLEVRVAAILLGWARKSRLLSSTATVHLPKVKVDPERFVGNHTTPTPAEAAQAIAAMPDDDWKLAAPLLARTGARIGEVVALRSRDLDLRTGRLALGGVDGASKTGLRWFPLDAVSLATLAHRANQGDAPLFAYRVGSPVQCLQRRLRQACEQAGVARFTPHGLRRMVVGRLLRARVDPGTAARLTGHSVQVMLRYYQEVTDEDRREAADRANLGDLGGIPAGAGPAPPPPP